MARPRLIKRLNAGQPSGRTPGLTVISAPAGFGKTTLLSEWVSQKDEDPRGVLHPSKVAWLSLDEGDNDSTRFLAYVVAALQTIEANIGAGVLGVLQSPQPPPAEATLTALLNEITALADPFILVLDDYHVIEAQAVDQALTFLIEHQPPQMRLVIATREDPRLPLARLRAQGQLTELRAADLRFTPAEAAEFLNPVMGLNLAPADIAALESRTEGWIAGLQLAALAMQGQNDVAGFIQSFTGSHHFVLDYLVEEVLQRQPEGVQTFLLRTSILERLCGPLCDAVMGKDEGGRRKDDGKPYFFILPPSAFTLESLERANLFIVPLDGERRWYRYHHLFADLLRQRLSQSLASAGGDKTGGVAELHSRASQWYEDNGLELEAFQHAAAANDFDRAARLIEGKGMPLQFRGAVAPVLAWLETLPRPVLDARPTLWVMYASALSMTGQTNGVEEKLQAAEAALARRGAEPDDQTRNLIGHIAAIRALLAATQYQVETIIAQSQRALEYLHPGNLPVRTATVWKLGIAYQLQGERAAASQAFTEAMAISQASGNVIINLSAATGLGQVQESENQLYPAAETYRRVLQLAGDPPLPIASEAYLGLARIYYEWNDLEAAWQHWQQSGQLAQQAHNTDRLVAGAVLLGRLKLAQGEVAGAAATLAEADQSARQHNLVFRIPEVAAVQVQTLLRQGNVGAAAELARTHKLPLSQARAHLAQGDPSAALAMLEPLRRLADGKGWPDERLKVRVLQAVAHQAQGETDQAVSLLGEALRLAEPGGLIRTFVDEGLPMTQLLLEAAGRGLRPDFAGKLLAAFEVEAQPRLAGGQAGPVKGAGSAHVPTAQPLIEPLSQRELEVLQLVAQGLSNHEISERLFVALDTVKGHNRRIYEKLRVQRRTEAVARARELGLL